MTKITKLRIQDVAEALQTDELKSTVLKQIRQFVYKYQRRYFPQYRGSLDDLALDLFTEFCTPKKHRNGETFSELDRLDPSIVGNGNWTASEEKAIATYTQRFVTHSLIDAARSYKPEVSASENYDENYKGLTIDRAARKSSLVDNPGDTLNSDIEALMHDPLAVKKARQRLLDHPEEVNRIKFLLKHYSDKLDPEIQSFIVNLIGEDEDLSEIDDEINEALDNPVKVTRYKLNGNPAIRISFQSKEEARDGETRSTLEQILSDYGYSFHKISGANMYFVQ